MSDATHPAEEDQRIVDWPAALEDAADDKELLGQLVTIFLDESQKNLSDIRTGLDDGDAKLLQRSAHMLKGSLRLFRSAKAQELAFRLERMGESASTDGAEPVLSQLVEQMKLVRAELQKGYHD